MKKLLLATCAAVGVSTIAAAAIADDGRYYDRGYSDGNNYRQGVIPPRALVRDLRHQGFSDIARPVLGDRFYQVKARDPNGRSVKLYIDPYSGQIARVKD